MKKNWMLRLGLLAMVLTLVTMPMVSSTYAKYVSEATGTDTARVAKWGVVVNADVKNIFGDAYDVTTSDLSVDYATGTVTVKAVADNTNIVAPGTKGSFKFGVTGQPEVSVAMTYDATIALSGWTVITAEDYMPINWTIQRSSDSKFWDGDTWEDTATNLTASQLDAMIDVLDANYAPNATTLANTYTVNWEWPFNKVGNWKSDSVGTDVTALYVANGSGSYVLSTVDNGFSGKYVPGTTYYTTAAGTTVANTSTFVPAGNVSYDQADTVLGNQGTAPTISITVVVTATQIN